MQVKYKSEELEIQNLKIIQTTKILEVAKELENSNKCRIITPFTKIKDIFKMGLMSPLFKQINENEIIQRLINENELEENIASINQTAGFELLQSNLELEKIAKILFQIKDDYVNNKSIFFLISLLDKYAIKNELIIILGMEKIVNQLITKKINNTLVNIILITSNIQKLELSFEKLELIVIIEKDIIDIVDYFRFKQ
jgi:uncharacterized protein (DUF2267 family)